MTQAPEVAFGVPRAEWAQLGNEWSQKAADEFTTEHLNEVKERGWALDLDPTLLLLDALYIRKLVTGGDNPPIRQVAQAGCITPLINIMENSNVDVLLFETTWALSSIAGGAAHHTQAVIDEHGVEAFAHLLETTANAHVFEEAACGLANIAGGGAQGRDIVLNAGVAKIAEARVHFAMSLKITPAFRNFVWMASNLCQGKPQPHLSSIEPLMCVFACALATTRADLKHDALWALSHITDGPETRSYFVQDHFPDIYGHLHQALSATPSLIIPAIRTVGNIATGTDELVQRLLDGGIGDCFPSLLQHPKRSVRKETCWTISNITAGNADHALLVTQPAILGPLLDCYRGADHDVQKEACWALTNAVSDGAPTKATVIDRLVEQDVAEALLDTLLCCADMEIVANTLEIIHHMLLRSTTILNETIGEQKLRDALAFLTASPSSTDDVLQVSGKILDKFFA